MKDFPPFKPEQLRVANEILAYLTENPVAEDTLEGIIQWWLTDHKILYQTNLVKEVVTELVNRGLLIARKNRDSLVHYHLNRNSYHENYTSHSQQKRKSKSALGN